MEIRRRLYHWALRTVAMFLGAFALLNLVGEAFHSGFDLNRWWIDFRPLPAWLGGALLAPAAMLLVAWSVRPQMPPPRRKATQVASAALLIVAIWNVLNFYLLLARGDIHTSVPVPLSLLVAAGMMMILRASARGALRSSRRGQWVAPAGGLALCALAFALLQMAFFGTTDYRRKADVVVVFGAGVYANGTCSQAAADRVRTACRLYHQGLVRRVLMSGGPGMGDVHETQAMRSLAMRLGVQPDDILLDPGGLSTAHTVANTAGMFEDLGAQRILAVSQFYHLPRIKMAYHRAGIEVYTVPAPQSRILRWLPYYMARETAAVWSYYVTPLKSLTEFL